MAIHKIYNDNNKFLAKLKFKSKTLNILRNIVLSLVVILLLNWVIALTTNVNLLGKGMSKLLEAIDIYDHAIPSISFSSDDWVLKDPGSWHINKSAKWTGTNTAEVVFDLDTTAKTFTDKETHTRKFDTVILVLDNSLSMQGNKLDRVKEHSITFINNIITNHNYNVGLVSFDDDAVIQSEFTKDISSLTDKINAIEAKGNTNYNDALKKVETLLDSYQRTDDSEVLILFLTDGVPCIDTPKEVDTYNALKEKYDYLSLYGIAFETGNISKSLADITDYQIYATRDSLEETFYSVETKIITHYEDYENFEITDYINNKYFEVKNESDIKVSRGSIKLEQQADGTQKIIWNLGENFETGLSYSVSHSSPEMTIKLTLKDQYVKDVDKDFYPTNKKEEATSKLKDQAENTKVSTDTPVLQRIYNVIYDYNPPTGCNIQNETSEKHYAFETVIKKDDTPVCPGYLFKGWDIVNENVTKVNDDMFIMPEENVTIRASWGKMNISKSMKGTSGKKPTLYEIAQSDAQSNNGAKIYEGEVTDQYNNTVTVKENAGTSDGIYYYTSKDHNNVIFAGFCWQMVRTTTTGGVKIVYNGIPENGTCKDDRGYILTVNNPNYHLHIDSSDLYGDSYTIDADTGEFTLTGNVQRADTFDKNDLIGKYTCYNSSGTNCSTLYHVNSLDGSYYAYATRYEPVHYANIGNSPFNSDRDSPAYVGYMYNTVYEYKGEEIILDTALWGNGVEWKDNTYHLTDTITGGPDANHHYTCATGSSTVATDTCTEVRYYYYTSSSYHYYIELTNGKKVEDALNEMLFDSDVNTKESDIKIAIDAWYEENMTDYTQYLEDTVFCNDRSIEALGAWDPNGSISTSLQFNNYNTKSTHVCPNETDQFAMNNSKARLTYPVGLLTAPEANMMGSTFAKTGRFYWLGSPSYFNDDLARERHVSAGGGLSNDYVDRSKGVRSAVSLNPGTKYTSGVGTVDDPYIVWPVTK